MADFGHGSFQTDNPVLGAPLMAFEQRRTVAEVGPVSVEQLRATETRMVKRWEFGQQAIDSRLTTVMTNVQLLRGHVEDRFRQQARQLSDQASAALVADQARDDRVRTELERISRRLSAAEEMTLSRVDVLERELVTMIRDFRSEVEARTLRGRWRRFLAWCRSLWS